MTLDRTRPLFVRLLLLAFLVLVPPVGLLSHGAMDEFARGLVPEMDKKAVTVGRDLAASIERAVGYGIPIARLHGMEEFFTPVLTANPEIRYLAVTDRMGAILFLSGASRGILEPYFAAADFEADRTEHPKAIIGNFINLTQPLAVKGNPVGYLHIGLDHDYVRDRLLEIAVDIGVVTLVSLLVAVEILLFVVTVNVTGPMRVVRTVVDKVRRGDFTSVCGSGSEDEVGRFVHGFNAAIRHADGLFRRLDAYIDEVKSAHFDKGVVERVTDIEARVRFLFRFSRSGQPEIVTERQATDIRLPLFLFVFAEEISRSFMPLYIRDLYAPIAGLSMEMVIAIPIAVFMLFIALASPSAALANARIGSRRVFLIGLVPAVIGFLMSALAYNVYDFTLWRAVTAVGYAIITMACQGYISQASQQQQQQQRRTQGLGVYVGAVLTASICGTGIGGVLAERVGYRTTFIIAAVLAMIAGMLIYRLVGVAHIQDRGLAPRKWDLLRLLRNWRFTALVLFAAIPSKIALTGFLFFLVPLTLIHGKNIDLGDVARMMMLYPITVVVLSSLAARLADRTGWKAGLVAVGGVVGGAGLLLPMVAPDIEMISLSIVLLGVSHGLSASPQLAMIPDVCWTECRNMGQTNVLAFLRLAERVGSVAGPLLAAALIPLYGQEGAIVALGGLVLGMSTIFALLSFAYGSGPHIEAELSE